MFAAPFRHPSVRLMSLLGLVALGGALAADSPPLKARRVPAPKDTASEPLSKPSEQRLDRVEAALKDSDSDLRALHATYDPDAGRSLNWARRIAALQTLHQSTVKGFVENVGNGMERKIPRIGLPEQDWTTDELEREPNTVKPAELEKLHLVNLLGLTLGFTPQTGALSTSPHAADRSLQKVDANALRKRGKRPETLIYTVRNVQLVGVVSHDAPTVYLASGIMMPTPEQKQQTRNINAFEAAGLDHLRTGEDLFVRQRGENVHLLGAIRATEACLKCHDGKRGDLLGAFSYTLVKNP